MAEGGAPDGPDATAGTNGVAGQGGTGGDGPAGPNGVAGSDGGGGGGGGVFGGGGGGGGNFSTGSGAGGGGGSSMGQPTSSFETGVKDGDGLVRVTYQLKGCGVADLAIAKSGPATVEPGGQIAWTMTITNNGPEPSTGSTVNDPIPAGVTNAATSTPGCSVAGGNLTCAVGPLAVGASTQIKLTGTAPATGSTCVTNGATVTGDQHDPNEANNSASAQTCTLLANVTIDKTSSKQRVTVGDTVVYTLTVRNEGPDAAVNPRVTDPVPSALDARKVSSSKGDCSLRGNRVVCTMGAMAVGETATVKVRAVAIRAGGTRNVAEVTDERCTAEPCDTDPAKVRIVKPKLQLTKHVKPKLLRAGDTATYTIRVRNPSKRFLRKVRVCDRLPSGLVFESSKPKAKVAKGRYCWTFKRIGAGKAKTIRMVVRALTGTSGRKVNRAVATSPDAKRARAKAPLRVVGGRVLAGGVTG